MLKKDDGRVPAFSRNDIETHVVIVLMINQSFARKNGADLRINADHSAFQHFFPSDDDTERNERLLRLFPNLLQFLGDDAEAPSLLPRDAYIPRSFANTVRILRPIVIVDEAHHVRSPITHTQLANLNPRFLLELTATPISGQANILARVSGKTLHAAEMIKMPIEVRPSTDFNDWRSTVKAIVDHRATLEEVAERYRQNGGRYIRPIALLARYAHRHHQKTLKGTFMPKRPASN